MGNVVVFPRLRKGKIKRLDSSFDSCESIISEFVSDINQGQMEVATLKLQRLFGVGSEVTNSYVDYYCKERSRSDEVEKRLIELSIMLDSCSANDFVTLISSCFGSAGIDAINLYLHLKKTN